MIKIITLFIFVGSAFAQYAVVENKLMPSLGAGKKALKRNASKYALVKINDAEAQKLSHSAHEDHHVCGGFFGFGTEEEASEFLKNLDFNNQKAANKFLNLRITKNAVVPRTIVESSEKRVADVIRKLSSFHNRHFKSEHGIKSQEWLEYKWKSITSHRSDVKVEKINHKGSWLNRYKQPSIILTIEGTEKPEEIIVLGGHADSINSGGLSGFFPGASKNKHAPGADDNASGIASLTEALYLLVKANYQPKRTIMFMAYAAEEAGLLGSKDIAKRFKKEKKNVIAALQFDMTNHKEGDIDINLVKNNTNKDLNAFIGKLVDTYLQISWGYTELPVGASSDHASWTAQGFPAAFPTEAFSDMRTVSKRIHTENDTIDASGGNAIHAEKFAKLGAAFAIEMAK